jgi:hypothetical protein
VAPQPPMFIVETIDSVRIEVPHVEYIFERSDAVALHIGKNGSRLKISTPYSKFLSVMLTYGTKIHTPGNTLMFRLMRDQLKHASLRDGTATNVLKNVVKAKRTGLSERVWTPNIWITRHYVELRGIKQIVNTNDARNQQSDVVINRIDTHAESKSNETALRSDHPLHSLLSQRKAEGRNFDLAIVFGSGRAPIQTVGAPRNNITPGLITDALYIPSIVISMMEACNQIGVEFKQRTLLDLSWIDQVSTSDVDLLTTGFGDVNAATELSMLELTEHFEHLPRASAPRLTDIKCDDRNDFHPNDAIVVWYPSPKRTGRLNLVAAGRSALGTSAALCALADVLLGKGPDGVSLSEAGGFVVRPRPRTYDSLTPEPVMGRRVSLDDLQHLKELVNQPLPKPQGATATSAGERTKMKTREDKRKDLVRTINWIKHAVQIVDEKHNVCDLESNFPYEIIDTSFL